MSPRDTAARILLVEDNPGDVGLVREALSHGRVLNELEVLADGEAAIARLRDASLELPHLVLLDVNLPGRDGHEVLADIRADPRLRPVPVIMLTTSAAPEDVARAYESGANSYIRKPVDLNGFLEAMHDFERFWLHIVELPGAAPRSGAAPERQTSTPGPEWVSGAESVAGAERPDPARAAPERSPTAGPPAAQPVTETVTEGATEGGTGSGRIDVLLVEDNPGDALLLETLVDGHAPGQFRFRVAPDLAEALRALRDRAFDLVLLDLALPDSSGTATFEAVRNGAGGAPIVVVTGLEDQTMALRTLQAGAQDYVVKGQSDAGALVRTLRYAVERARADAMLRRAQKIEAMARLAGGVAHDFNNMLQVIRGHAELLSLTRSGADDTESTEAILDACAHASDLVRQLLSFGSRPITFPRLLEADRVIEGTSALVRGLMGESVTVEYVLACDGRVRGDPVQIEQMLLNLALNARHAMDDRGRLQVRTRRETQTRAIRFDSPRGPVVVIEVEDDGCGMSDDVRERAFEPFFTTRKESEGSGLGLSSVYGIARQMGGTVELRSAPGEGTCVRIVLPLEAAPSSEPEAARLVSGGESRDGDRRGASVLLVDDEVMLRNMLERMLTSRGHRVLSAADANEARAHYEECGGAVDLLVTDVVMPGDSGVELYRDLLARRADLPALLISGYTDDRLSDAADIVGTYRFLEKPFDSGALFEAVDALLQGDQRSG